MNIPLSPEIYKLTQEKQLLMLTAAYLLYEKREETRMTAAFAALVQERHRAFHRGGQGTDGPEQFADCKNMVCTDAAKMIANTRAMEVSINPFAAQIVSTYEISFIRAPSAITARLTKKENTAPPVAVAAAAVNGGKIVLTD